MKTEIIGGIIIIVGTIAVSLKELIKAYTKKIINSWDDKPVVLTSHPIFYLIDLMLEQIKNETFSENPYKQAVIKELKIIFWNNANKHLSSFCNKNFLKLDSVNFDKELNKTLKKINEWEDELHKKGVSLKTIDVISKTTFDLQLFMYDIIHSITSDSIYKNNKIKAWAVLTVLENFLCFFHNERISRLIDANGNLSGEIFNDIINDGTN